MTLRVSKSEPYRRYEMPRGDPIEYYVLALGHDGMTSHNATAVWETAAF